MEMQDNISVIWCQKFDNEQNRDKLLIYAKKSYFFKLPGEVFNTLMFVVIKYIICCTNLFALKAEERDQL